METDAILKMSSQQQLNYWVGHLLVAIGSGDFRGAVYELMTFYQREAYERGVKEGARRAQPQVNERQYWQVVFETAPYQYSTICVEAEDMVQAEQRAIEEAYELRIIRQDSNPCVARVTKL